MQRGRASLGLNVLRNQFINGGLILVLCEYYGCGERGKNERNYKTHMHKVWETSIRHRTATNIQRNCQSKSLVEFLDSRGFSFGPQCTDWIDFQRAPGREIAGRKRGER